MSVFAKLTRAAGNHCEGSYSLLILAPIRAGRRDALEGLLRSFEEAGTSPLVQVHEVHFARWIVIDQLKTGFKGEARHPTQLDRPWLLFSAEYTPAPREAVPGAVLARVADVGEAVWRECEGCPDDAAARAAFLARHRCDTTLYYAGYPGKTPAQVKDALRRRDALIRFALEHRDERDAATLQRRYLEEAATWF